jgi:hypothetical protein
MQLWFTGEKEYRCARKKEENKFQDSIMDLELKDICMEHKLIIDEVGSEMIAFTKKDCPIYSKSRR